MSGLNRMNPLLIKMLIIVLLTLVLLVPLGRVESLIAERAALRDTAVGRVANSVGHAAIIFALMMVVTRSPTWVGDGTENSENNAHHALSSFGVPCAPP